ncbi:MAG: low molecular weight protein-tyrosine-phosphatase [Bacteroidota bacterium]|nr:low molecular weight protein-tyrosine-phosphatase [Bacteroidota bacterium]
MTPTSILFVCLGNICRSPMAEGIFLRILAREGSSERFVVDSAGLLDYHQGELADPRMRAHASAHGYTLMHRSRPVTKADLDRFDWIICMDDQNIRGLKQLTTNPLHWEKIHLMTGFCRDMNASQVPDPYYEGDQGFEYVIDLLEDACEGLYDALSRGLI